MTLYLYYTLISTDDIHTSSWHYHILYFTPQNIICLFTTIHKNGSQQATKAAPKHTHNDRLLSECFKYKVLRWPIFSIGHGNDTSPQIARLTRQTKWRKLRNKLPTKPKLIQANWLNQWSLCPDQKRMNIMLESRLTIHVAILPEILLQESKQSKSLDLILVLLKSGSSSWT